MTDKCPICKSDLGVVTATTKAKIDVVVQRLFCKNIKCDYFRDEPLKKEVVDHEPRGVHSQMER